MLMDPARSVLSKGGPGKKLWKEKKRWSRTSAKIHQKWFQSLRLCSRAPLDSETSYLIVFI